LEIFGGTLISILVVSHGALAEGMLDAMQMITGPQEKVLALGLKETEAPEDLIDRIREAADALDDGDGVLIMVDLYGATPFNSSSRLFMESSHSIEVVTGVNLPMLVEIVMSREGVSLADLLQQAYQAGQGGIKLLPDSIRKGKTL
jgi:PTS system mannose-specific IIA component